MPCTVNLDVALIRDRKKTNLPGLNTIDGWPHLSLITCTAPLGKVCTAASRTTSAIAASTFGYSAASSSSIVRSASGRLKYSDVLDILKIAFKDGLSERIKNGRGAYRIASAKRNPRISQPALSRSIQKREDDLAQPVFERRARSVAVTDTGLQLQSRAQQVLSVSEDIMAEITDNGQSGRI